MLAQLRRMKAHTVNDSLPPPQTDNHQVKMVKWLPLESNPDVINKFSAELGISKEYQVSERTQGMSSSPKEHRRCPDCCFLRVFLREILRDTSHW